MTTTHERARAAIAARRNGNGKHQPNGARPALVPVVSLAEARATFRRWLGLSYDMAIMEASAATLAAHRLTGDPLWLLAISGSGNAKTETAQAALGAGAIVVSTISSPAALLSGTPKREKESDASGGLLRTLGDGGVLVIKDFTSTLSMHREARGEVLAALREIYDGNWTRDIGAGGGRRLTWSGRIGVIAVSTTAYDQAHDVINKMGDRFVVIRTDSTVGRMEAGRQAIANTGHEVEMRDDLARAIGGLVAAVQPDTAPMLAPDETETLLAVANIVTLARTGVTYDYRGDVVDTNAPEMPTRFAKELAQMFRGAVAIGLTRTEALALAVRCGADSIPPLRFAILQDVAEHPGATTTEVRKRLDKPRATVDRQLQSLQALGMLTCSETDSHRGTVWHWSLSGRIDRDALARLSRARNVVLRSYEAKEGDASAPDISGTTDLAYEAAEREGMAE